MSPDDKDFILMLASRVKRGQYVKAAERVRAAEIATQHPEFVKLQRLPTTASAGEWARVTKYLSAPRAPERTK